MIRPERHPSVLFLAAADMAIAALSLYIAYWIRAAILPRFWPSLWTGNVFLHPSYGLLLVGSLPMLLYAMHLSGGYSWARLRGGFQIFVSIAKAFGMTAIGVLAFAYVLRDRSFSRAIVAAYLLLTFGGAFLLRLAVRDVLRIVHDRSGGLQNAILVGTGTAAQEIARLLRRKPYLGYRVVGFVTVPEESSPSADLPVLGTVEELPRIVDERVIDAVVFGVGLDVAARYEQVIWKLEEVGKTVHLRGDAIGVMLSRTFIGEFEGMPILTLTSVPTDTVALAIKRAIDIAGSLFGLVLLSPVFLVTALAVKLSSPGPVFYSQERVGRNGRRFKMHKFRSMYIDAEKRLEELRDRNEMTGPVFKMKDDPRVTPVGRWIRKLSIDELPQLWNVLVGEMSLVGPRPPIPKEVEKYERWQRRRLSMKPGITCLWQVGGRNELDFDTWMKLDMEYIDNWSLKLDLKILLKTIPVVLTAKGAR